LAQLGQAAKIELVMVGRLRDFYRSTEPRPARRKSRNAAGA
jgi:hypothetical protein